mmetsp:Transcript_70534/g.125545  ORF Transcript_70534/g.125545 Transcript_70534/m.125545 type:complete len:83 (+) Transcript_70534:119-367(+)
MCQRACSATSATLAKYAEEEQEELHDVQVQGDGCKGVVIKAEFVGTVVLSTDDELRVVHDVEGEEKCSATCIQQIQALHGCS